MMDTDQKSLKKLLKLMRNEGVLSLKLPNCEITLSPDALRADPGIKSPSPDTPQAQEPAYDPMDTLLWSAPGSLIPEEERH